MASTLMTTAIGIVGTLMGSGLTAFVTARTERRKDEALERQQIRQEASQDRSQLRELRVEHRKWRRDRRQAAYQALMDAAHDAQGTIWQLSRLTVEPYDQERYDTWRGASIDAVRAAQRAANAVQLEGPPSVAQAAALYADAVDRHISPPIQYMMELSNGPVSGEFKGRYHTRVAETTTHLEAMHRRFDPLAREALDELMSEGDQHS